MTVRKAWISGERNSTRCLNISYGSTYFLTCVQKLKTCATYLITSGASRLQRLGIMAFTVNKLVTNAIRQVDQKVLAGMALEALSMPVTLLHPENSHAELLTDDQVAALADDARRRHHSKTDV